MKTFNHIKDRHFPEGYSEWIQDSIDKTVSNFLTQVSNYYDLETIKTVFDIGSLNGIESVKFAEKLGDISVYTFEPKFKPPDANPELYDIKKLSENGTLNAPISIVKEVLKILLLE